MLGVMALKVLRIIAEDVSTSKSLPLWWMRPLILVPLSNLFVLHWVGIDLDVHEDFIGLYSTDCISSGPLVSIVKDALLRVNLCIENCRGQC